MIHSQEPDACRRHRVGNGGACEEELANTTTALS